MTLRVVGGRVWLRGCWLSWRWSGVPPATPTSNSVPRQEATERLAQGLASELPELMDSHPTTPTYRQLSDLPPVDGIEHVAVYDVGTVTSRAPDSDQDALGVDLAVSVKFPGRDTCVCVVLAATSTGASDAVVAPAVPLDECENPPGRLGRGDFAGACDLLRRDDLGQIC